MSQLIASLPGELSSTPEGRAWVTKALHPADPITDCRGIPDESNAPTVVVTYNTVQRLSFSAAGPSWGFDLTVMPNVICQGFARVYDSTGVTVGLVNFLNQGLTPPGVPAPSYAQLLAQFRSMGIEAHRLVYMGVTAYQDGPALADQGTIVGAQWEVARKKYCTTFVNGAGLGTHGPLATRRAVTYQDSDFAQYERSQYLPNAYFSMSKAGAYLPLRLQGRSWVTDADLELPLVEASLFPGRDDMNYIPAAAPGTPTAPFPALDPVWYEGATGALHGDSVYRPLNHIWGGLSARNLSPQTSFAFYYRVAIECRVSPTSVFASQVRMSPMYDPTALAAYVRISRELKDAYPADYNDLGKIWEVIKQAARVVLPVISGLGPIGAAVGAGGSAALGLVDAIRARREAAKATGGRGEADKPPAAAVQRVQDEQHAAAARETGSRRKPRRK